MQNETASGGEAGARVGDGGRTSQGVGGSLGGAASGGAGGDGAGGATSGGSGAGGLSSGGGSSGGTNSGGSGGAPVLLDPAEDLGPTVRGLLFSDKSDVYGWAQSSTPFGQDDDPQVYFFATNGRLFTLFFPAANETDGLTYHEGLSVRLPNGETAEYNVTYRGPGSADALGLYADAYIATLEVNDGRGNDGRANFVVTDATIESGAPPFTLDPVLTMGEAKAEFLAALAEVKEEVESLLMDGRASTAAPEDTVFSQSSGYQLRPNWDDERGVLIARFTYSARESWDEFVRHDPGTTGIPPHDIYQTRSYYVEYEKTYEFDSAGALLGTTEEPPTLNQ